MRSFWVIAGVGLLAVVGYAAYLLLRTDVLAAAYRHRLEALSRDYEHLAARYASVVKRTAVTELVSHQGKLSVVISTVDGELKRIPTPFDPSNEIHVDYVVRDGRLWIRRVHDAATPAKDALVIDPELAGIDWNRSGTEYGLVIYRPLTEGRWIISVTANGALSLVKQEASAQPIPLAAAPQIKGAEELEREAQAAARQRMEQLGAVDVAAGVWHALTN